MEQKNGSFNLLVSRRFLSEQRNGISRDAKSIISALKRHQEISLFELESSTNIQGGFFARIFRLFKTVVFRKPTFYESESYYSFIPQLQNMLPSKHSTAFIRIHDVFPVSNSGWYRLLTAMSFRITLNCAVLNNHTFICNSFYTKNQLSKYYPSAKAEVLYCFPEKITFNSCSNCQYCENSNAFEYPFFLSVGTIEPRKNYLSLVAAWKQVGDVTGSKFIVVGKKGWKSNRTYSKLKNLSNLLYLENVCDFGVSELISKSEVLVSFSFDEGFNYPAMDAALSGKPLLLSDIPVHRELYGNSPMYFEVANPDALVNALLRIKLNRVIISDEFFDHVRNFDKKLKDIIFDNCSNDLNITK